ncbi:MAG: hypothetical protein M3209_03980 [Acidobacteriota bacterium]|nr:hypothetical protein [Acidobacteriota bacterium]
MTIKFFIVLILLIISAGSAFAQTTEFTYQGRLNDGATAANSNYDFEFRLYDAVSGGNLLGTQTRLGVPVTNGVFAVRLDFGAQFTGAARFLGISVKPAGSANPYTPLAPRLPVTSTPYAIRSLNSGTADTATNSLSLGGAAANQFVQTTDARLSDARNPLPNSPNYIRNSTQQQASTNFSISGTGDIGGNSNIGGNLNVSGNTLLLGGLTVTGTLSANLPSGDSSYIQNRTSQQPATNFNISGNGTVSNTLFAGTINSASQYQLNGNRFLSNYGVNNTFAGIDTGAANSGTDNSFFGYVAGNANTSGSNNSFLGSDAGGSNTSGNNNSFFGSDTGDSNTTGFDNSFFGRSAGSANTTANSNSFFGTFAGESNTANFNSFFGAKSGQANATGTSNSFFGYIAGAANTSGGGNSFFGKNAGDSNTDGDNNSFFGLLAGTANTSGNSNVFMGISAGDTNTTGSNNTVVGASADVGANNLTYATAIGAGTVVSLSNTIQLGRSNGTDWVEIPGRTYSRQRLEVGTSSNDASLFVYGFTSITGNLSVGGGAAVQGNLSKGGGSFKIDHPLDPLNKYLYHSFVESPDMMNIYNGNTTTNEKGEATITLPTYFEALNRDFRYQLTVIGVFAQAIVAEEINGNQFKIRTDKPGVKVSWQVTGIRKDPFAEQNRIKTEVEKPEKERGTYLYPKAYEQKTESSEPLKQTPKL